MVVGWCGGRCGVAWGVGYGGVGYGSGCERDSVQNLKKSITYIINKSPYP